MLLVADFITQNNIEMNSWTNYTYSLVAVAALVSLHAEFLVGR